MTVAKTVVPKLVPLGKSPVRALLGAGCLAAYLTGGDIPGARAKLHARLRELPRFGDPAIDDARVVRQ